MKAKKDFLLLALVIVVIVVTSSLSLSLAEVKAENGDSSIILSYTSNLEKTIEHIRQLGYVVGLGLIIIGGMVYGLSALSSSVDPAHSIQGRGTGMRIIIAGIIVLALSAAAKDIACSIISWFGKTPPSFCM